MEAPHTLVLSTDTGYPRNYRRDPYADYEKTDALMFPVGKIDQRLSPKSWVLGIKRKDFTMAYPFSELAKGPKSFTERIGTETLRISYDAETRTARIRDMDGIEVPSVVAYWFAWAAFHPETQLYAHP